MFFCKFDAELSSLIQKRQYLRQKTSSTNSVQTELQEVISDKSEDKHESEKNEYDPNIVETLQSLRKFINFLESFIINVRKQQKCTIF